MLLGEILMSCIDQRVSKKQDVVLDLCAGSQSWAPVARKFGCRYIAVDVLGDRNLSARDKKVGGALEAR